MPELAETPETPPRRAPRAKIAAAVEAGSLEVTLRGEVNQPSVWVESATGKEIRYGVKVYGADAREALAEAKRLFTELRAYALNLPANPRPRDREPSGPVGEALETRL